MGKTKKEMMLEVDCFLWSFFSINAITEPTIAIARIIAMVEIAKYISFGV
jgi:hypothetical protein